MLWWFLFHDTNELNSINKKTRQKRNKTEILPNVINFRILPLNQFESKVDSVENDIFQTSNPGKEGGDWNMSFLTEISLA